MSETCCGGACTVAAPAAPPAEKPDATRQWVLVALSGLLIAFGAWAAWRGWRPLSIAADIAAIALTIGTPLRRAGRSLRTFTLDINVLMVIAVAGAALLGDWLEAASVVWLFGIAQWLEARSMNRARRAIRSLVTMAPSTAVVLRHGAETSTPVTDVRVGDVVIVRPGERVPVDGVVLRGESAIDQSSVTGESWPIDKGPGDDVFAGTLNGTGAIDVETTRPSSDSTLARIVHLVEEAQSRRAPVQLFVDRFARRYTPVVVVLAAALAFLVPLIVAGPSGWSAAFGVWSYRALTLLVVACPCALVISTPVSIVSALTAAARAGVLIKGGAHLEKLGEITCIAFDKTGTLTHGDVTIADIVAVEGASEDGVLLVAAALESRSEHAIGRAIVDRARARGLEVVPGDAFRALPGLGAEALVAAAPAVVGSHRLFEQRQLCTPSLHARIDEVEGRGRTPVLVSHGGAALGVIGFTDLYRDVGRDVVAQLKSEGIRRVALLTGDRTASADAAREATGLDEAHGALLPADKVAHIERLRATYGPVAMVGDGVNDAPALAAADVGIAMGVAGTDVALETADVALLSDDLTKVPYALRLGRATLSNIRWNLAIAIGLKVAFIALAVSGVATLWMAVLADTGASLLVTANSLRLLRVR